jgi:hypothetical protein
VPLDLCAGGTLTQSRLVHSILWRETPSKRKEEAWVESRREGREKEPPVEAVLETVFEAIKSVEAGVEAAVEAGVEAAVEAGNEPTSEARHDAAAEARVDSGAKTASHVLGVKLAGSPQRYHES